MNGIQAQHSDWQSELTAQAATHSEVETQPITGLLSGSHDFQINNCQLIDFNQYAEENAVCPLDSTITVLIVSHRS